MYQAEAAHTEETAGEERPAPETSAEEAPLPEDDAPDRDSGPRLAAMPDNPQPGEPVTVALALVKRLPYIGPFAVCAGLSLTVITAV